MCTEPLYAIRLKTEFDERFKRFGKRSKLIVLKSVRDVDKDTSQLHFDRSKYDLLMISCGQCTQCRLLRVKQRAVMCMAEQKEHKSSLFLTLTIGYPQTYAYYRHPPKGSGQKPLSHYLASKRAHFLEWSLDVSLLQKFIKRLRNWYYNYQLANYLKSKRLGYLLPDTDLKDYYTHIRLPNNIRDVILKDFQPKRLRFMSCGEYGEKKQRAHYHSIVFSLDLPDLKFHKLSHAGEKLYTSDIISRLWSFGIHEIGECTYNSCSYVARYVTKKINGKDQDLFYNGRKPEFITYSTKPVLGAKYFIDNIDEFINTQKVTIFSGKKYQCSIPRSYDNIIKKLDINRFNSMKDERVERFKTDLDKLFKQDRSLCSKLNSNVRIVFSTIKKLIRGFESEPSIIFDDILKKAKAFGVSTKHFGSDTEINAVRYLLNKTFRDFKSRNTNENVHRDYYNFERERKRRINECYSLLYSKDFAVNLAEFIKNEPNPFKVKKRGRSLPDIESLENEQYIDEKGEIYEFGQKDV